MKTVEQYLEAGLIFGVTGAALIWPPAALIVGALFFVALAVVVDRRTPPPEVKP